MCKVNVLLFMARRLSTGDQKKNIYLKKCGDCFSKVKWFELTTIHLFQCVEVSSFVVKHKSYQFKQIFLKMKLIIVSLKTAKKYKLCSLLIEFKKETYNFLSPIERLRVKFG